MDDSLLKDFIAESREHLETIEADLLTIEEAGENIDEELVNKVFRAAHSIKGGSSFFALNKIKELAHGAETVLDMVRSRKMVPNAEIINILLQAFDKLRDMINHAAESNETDISIQLSSLVNLTPVGTPKLQKINLSERINLTPSPDLPVIPVAKIDYERAQRRASHIYYINFDLIHDVERNNKTILQVFKDLNACGEILESQVDYDAMGLLDGPMQNQLPIRLIFATVLDPLVIGGLFETEEKNIYLLYAPHNPDAENVSEAKSEPEPVATPSLPETVVAAEPDPAAESDLITRKPDKNEPPVATPPAAPADSTLRVSVSLLESLMNLAGELVLSRNQLREAMQQKDERNLVVSAQRINLVTSELQDTIMQTRMQPIGTVFGKFPRVVRDIALAQKKEMELHIVGKDVGLDKSLVEGLSDPLIHMIRNAADHGVETPEERKRAGKKTQGTLRLEARHEAGQVVIEIADDGKGIDPERIGQSALKKGLITPEKLRGMSDKDKTALIFLPGLSTADKVTDVSGRGVGMDVVKTNLDRLGGKVEIESEVGKGTTFRIKLPLTLAIIPSLIITVEGERFAIPQISVVELLRIQAEHVKKRIEVVGNAEVLLLRNQLVPIVRFADIVGILPTYMDPRTGRREIDRRALGDRRSPHREIVESAEEHKTHEAQQQQIQNKRKQNGRREQLQSDLDIVVVTTGTMQFGLVVESFRNTEEIVVKPLGRHLKGLQEYAGATIMGDGKVALILDVGGVAAKADLAPLSGSTRAEELANAAEKERLEDTHSLLLFCNAPDELCAIPLSAVLRVERITENQVETAGGKRTMQYRGASLPLITLSDTASVKPLGQGRELEVIVSRVHGREVGLLGTMPVDVVETREKIDQETHRQTGIAGSAIIHDKTVLLTDIYEMVDTLFPDWKKENEAAAPPKNNNPGNSTTVLLAEDSDFFRAQVKRYLTEGGYTVVEGEDGEAAWEQLLKNVDAVKAVITDIEMPRLTGLGLTERIRKDKRVASLPIIGLTSLASDEDVARGKAVGIDDYQIKLDREKLLETLNKMLSITEA